MIDIDDEALEAACRELGTSTVSDTVNAALRVIASNGATPIQGALGELAAQEYPPRSDAWR